MPMARSRLKRLGAVEEVTYGDFTAPTRNVQLPTLPDNGDKAIGAGGKPVIIKKNIFEKNRQSHSFSNDETRLVKWSVL